MFASKAQGYTLHNARNAAQAELGPDVVRNDFKARSAGRGVEFIPNGDGTFTVRLHNLDRTTERGPKATTYGNALRVDFTGAVNADPVSGLLITRASLAVYHRRVVQAAVDQPDGIVTKHSIDSAVDLVGPPAGQFSKPETHEERAAREYAERQRLASAVFGGR